MRYITYFILFSTLLLGSQAAHGQEQRYRVELLVLRHLEGYSANEPSTALSDFSAAMDLLAPPAEDSQVDPGDLPGAQPGDQAGVQSADQSGNQSVAQPENGLQPPVAFQETPGEVMQQAWRRLRSANGLRPELYFSWEQAASAGSPDVRVHDQMLLLEQDPGAGLQDASLQQQEGAAEAGTEVGVDLPAEPTRYYRLDGIARLRVSRFLHLDLDIEYREPAVASGQQSPALSAPSDPAPSSPGNPPATAYQVYTVRQSRQVQIQDLHYFDGPVISVLALVSRVEPLPEAIQ